MSNQSKVFPIEDLHWRKNVVARECPNCHKQFAIRKCFTQGCKQSFCSYECYSAGRTIVDRYRSRMPSRNGYSPHRKMVQKVLRRRGFYKSHKEEYRNKIIRCEDSPTGTAYVGINKEPFMPAVDGGHGYQGVLLQDENREYVQCHACGKWMQRIANKHTESCCGLTIQQYKEKYGLNHDQGLVSDETSLRCTEACLKNKIEARQRENNLDKGRSQKEHNRSGKKHSMEFFNKFGTCPLQLKTRLYEFIRCNRELPSQGNRGRSIYKALKRRYGSFGHALSAHGLPWMKRNGSTMRFAFSDGTIYRYNMNQFYDREELFRLMMEKCPALSQTA